MYTDVKNAHSVIVNPPNHAPDHAQVRYSKLRNHIKSQAKQSLDRPAQIYAQAVSETDPDVQLLLCDRHISTCFL